MAKAESIEKTAPQTAQAAEEGAGALLSELQPALDALTDSLHTLAEHSRALALDAGHQTRDSVLLARDRTSEYIAEKPFQSLAIATAAGLAFGWLIRRR